MFAWGIGALAIVVNIIVLTESLYKIKICKSPIAFSNRMLILLISIGDFLTGLYLVLVALADLLHGPKYCENR